MTSQIKITREEVDYDDVLKFPMSGIRISVYFVYVRPKHSMEYTSQMFELSLVFIASKYFCNLIKLRCLTFIFYQEINEASGRNE